MLRSQFNSQGLVPQQIAVRPFGKTMSNLVIEKEGKVERIKKERKNVGNLQNFAWKMR